MHVGVGGCRWVVQYRFSVADVASFPIFHLCKQ